MDKYNIDSHKLMFHPREVADWTAGCIIDPIYVEVSTSGACNHRCKFCALDYVGYKPHYLDVTDYIKWIVEMTGIKAVMFGGEGEPLMHRHFTDIAAATFTRGIDCSLTTNGVLLTPGMTDQIARMMKWVKVSVDAGNKQTYSNLRKCNTKDFSTVWDNITYYKKKFPNAVLGTQFLLLEDNVDEYEDFLRLSYNTGADYAVIKIYSQHLHSKNKQRITLLDEVDKGRIEDWNGGKFKVIVREDKGTRGYGQCRALPFWRYLQATGDLWACSAHLGDNEFLIGNIGINTIDSMKWRSEEIHNMMVKFDISNCRLNCRMNNVNEYLQRLQNPQEHDNFI